MPAVDKSTKKKIAAVYVHKMENASMANAFVLDPITTVHQATALTS